MQCGDREAVARRWATLLDRTAHPGPHDVLQIALDQGTLRFVRGPAGADGVTVVDIAVADRQAAVETAKAHGVLSGDDLMICGTRIRLV
jgi:hypothetical protein